MNKCCVIVLGLIFLSGCSSSTSGVPSVKSSREAAPRDLSAIFRQRNPNWVTLCNDPAFTSQQVTFEIVIDGQGRIVGEPKAARPSANQSYQVLGQTALATLRASEPFRIFSGLQIVSFTTTFDATDACAGPL